MNLVINAAEAIEGDAGKVTVSVRIRDFDTPAAAQISSEFPAGRPGTGRRCRGFCGRIGA